MSGSTYVRAGYPGRALRGCSSEYGARWHLTLDHEWTFCGLFVYSTLREDRGDLLCARCEHEARRLAAALVGEGVKLEAPAA